MTVKLVNTSPGEVAAPFVPGQLITMGLRSPTGAINPSNLQMDFSSTALVNTGVLPENETKLRDAGASISFGTAENEYPPTGDVLRSFSGTSLTFVKSGSGAQDNGIYSVKVPIRPNASVLGYFKFRINTAWQLVNPDWCDLANLVGLYFGLEHGSLNTAAYVFLRDDGLNGTLVVGGPQAGPSQARPGEFEINSLDASSPGQGWKLLSNNTMVELFILFNLYTNPYSVEIWARRAGDSLQYLASVPVGTLGSFPQPSGLSNNFRAGPTDFATLFFGLSGGNGDVLVLDDWALYPDYRKSISGPASLPSSTMKIVPSGPTIFKASNRVKLESLNPDRWLQLSDGVALRSDLLIQPGPNSQEAEILHAVGLRGGLQRKEPRLETLVDGATVEGYMSASVLQLFGASTSVGFGIDDGSASYRLLAVETPTLRTVGVPKSEPSSFVGSSDPLNNYYFVATSVDYRNPTFLRLTVDRRRSEVLVYAGDQFTPALVIPFSGSTFPSSNIGRFILGSLTALPAQADLKVSSLLYLARYLAWEGRDNKLPTDATLDPGLQFTLNAVDPGGSVAMSGSELVVTRAGGTSGNRYFTKAHDFGDRRGLMVDFKVYIPSYTNNDGLPNSNNTDSGVGLRCYLGNEVLQLAFIDAGLAGKRVGIVPLGGSISDLVNFNTVGAPFTAAVDWTKPQNYRLLMRPYDSLKLWIGSILDEPVLNIPWSGDNFPIPADLTAAAIQFGHFGALNGSVSKWGYVRWGSSDGYDISVKQDYPDGLKPYLYGGKFFSTINFYEA